MSLSLRASVVDVGADVTAFAVGIVADVTALLCKTHGFHTAPVHKQRILLVLDNQPSRGAVQPHRVLCARLYDLPPPCHPQVLLVQCLSVDIFSGSQSAQLPHFLSKLCALVVAATEQVFLHNVSLMHSWLSAALACHSSLSARFAFHSWRWRSGRFAVHSWHSLALLQISFYRLALYVISYIIIPWTRHSLGLLSRAHSLTNVASILISLQS